MSSYIVASSFVHNIEVTSYRKLLLEQHQKLMLRFQQLLWPFVYIVVFIVVNVVVYIVVYIVVHIVVHIVLYIVMHIVVHIEHDNV